MTQHELVHKVYKENKNIIDQKISNSKYPNTHKTLNLFYHKNEDLKDSLEFMKDNKNFYSSQCLARILFEHFIVAFFIWNKCRIEKSDECAGDYFKCYAVYEFIKQTNYDSKLDNSFDSKKGPLENFLIKNPDFDDPNDPLTEDNFRDINTRANKFDIRKILKYIQDGLEKEDHFKKLEIPILKICKNYNRLSSYVHGGRTAEMQTFENIPPIDKEKTLLDNYEWAVVFSQQILSLQLILLLQEDTSTWEIYRPIYEFSKSRK